MDLNRILNFSYSQYSWYFDGDEIYANLIWDESNSISKPSESELESRWADTQHNVKLHLLRLIRNNVLQSNDWVVIKHYSQGTPVPGDWATYMQTLRDLPVTQISNVVIDSQLLSITNIEQIFPTNPDGVQFPDR